MDEQRFRTSKHTARGRHLRRRHQRSFVSHTMRPKSPNEKGNSRLACAGSRLAVQNSSDALLTASTRGGEMGTHPTTTGSVRGSDMLRTRKDECEAHPRFMTGSPPMRGFDSVIDFECPARVDRRLPSGDRACRCDRFHFGPAVAEKMLGIPLNSGGPSPRPDPRAGPGVPRNRVGAAVLRRNLALR